MLRDIQISTSLHCPLAPAHGHELRRFYAAGQGFGGDCVPVARSLALWLRVLADRACRSWRCRTLASVLAGTLSHLDRAIRPAKMNAGHACGFGSPSAPAFRRGAAATSAQHAPPSAAARTFSDWVGAPTLLTQGFPRGRIQGERLDARGQAPAATQPERRGG